MLLFLKNKFFHYIFIFKTRTTIVVSNGRYTIYQIPLMYQIPFIKYHLSNTIYQKYHLANTIYQIPFIKYHLSKTFFQIPIIKYFLLNTIDQLQFAVKKFFFNESMNQFQVFLNMLPRCF